MNRFFRNVLGISLLLVATLLVASFASCKGNGKKGGGGETKKNFDVKSIKIWEKSVKDKASETFSGAITDRSLVVEVANPKAYKLAWSIQGGATGTFDATDGTVNIDPFDIPSGTSTLEIKLTASGFNDWSQSIKLTRNAPVADVEVQLKRDEDGSSIVITEGNEYETGKESAELTLKAESGEMVSVTAGTGTLAVAADGKTASGTVSCGNIEVIARFKEHRDFTFSFKLTKVEGDLQLNVTKATIFSGDDWAETQALSIEKDNEYKEVQPKDVRYGVVKLEMEFDAGITKAQITRCEDERSDGYIAGEGITQGDFYDGGIFSGRVVKEVRKVSENGRWKTEVTELKNVEGNKYTEYLIVGKGSVEYDIEFSAPGRKAVTYTVKIKNPLKVNLKQGENLGLGLFGARNGNGLILTWPGFRWLQYLKAPVNQASDEAFLNMMQNPEYMGDIVRLDVQGQKAKMGKLGQDFHFFYNVIEEDEEACHNFVRVFSNENTPKTYVFTMVELDPQEKKVDAFVGFHKALPLPMMPLHLAKPFKKIVNKGFVVNTVAGEDYQDKFEEAFYYRIQAKIFEALNKEGGHTEDNAMKISAKQKYAEFLNGEPKTETLLTGSSANKTKVAGRDVLSLTPTFAGKFSEIFESISCKVSKKEGGTGEWQEVQTTDYELTKWDGAPFLIIGAKQGWIDKWTGKLDEADASDIYCFEKGNNGSENMYKIEVTTKLKADSTKEEYFDIILNYKDTYTQGVMSLDNGGNVLGGANMFGLPVFGAENVVRMEPSIARELAKTECFRR